jgi:GPH family glycoside/pentoside/hexuronide:cation symporter
VDASLAAGLTQQQGYLIVSSLFGGISIIPLVLIFFFVHHHQEPKPPEQPIPLKIAIRIAWSNVPFRIAAILNMLNWLSADFVALVIPYFLLYWIARGDLIATVNLFGLDLSLEAAVLGLLLLVAILAIPFWNWLANRLGKRNTYLVGILPWILAYIALFLVQPGQVNWMLVISAVAGLGIATGYILPEAIFPDVIEWDELLTRRRQEGIYYGIKNFVRKISGALAFFLALQVLGWSGYQAPPSGAISFQQPESALLAIRLLVGPAGAVLLIGAAITAWFYPLTRERHGRIRRLLAARKSRQSESD